MRDGRAELTVARRRPTRVDAWPLHARIANRELARRVRASHRRTECETWARCASRAGEPLLELGQRDRRSGYPVETVVQGGAAPAGASRAVDVDYHPRAGRSKVTGTVRGTMQAVRDMRAALSEQ